MLSSETLINLRLIAPGFFRLNICATIIYRSLTTKRHKEEHKLISVTLCFLWLIF